MLYLPQGGVNSRHLLSLVVVDTDGFLTDPDVADFRLLGPDGSVVEDWADATASGYADTGFYYAPYTFADDAETGKWRIEWRWKLLSTDATYQTWTLPFYVEAIRDDDAGTGFEGLGYAAIVSPSEMRALGLTTGQVNDARLEELIGEVQEYIEEATRNVFRPVLWTGRISGRGTSTLLLPTALIGLGDVWLNEQDGALLHDVLLPSVYDIHDTQPRVVKPDPRRNPLITIKRSGGLFSGAPSDLYMPFHQGTNNIKVKGVFGFLDANGQVPKLLVRAAAKTVFATAVAFSVGGTGVENESVGLLRARTVDFYSESYNTSGGAASLSSSLARSPEVEEILMKYRAPMGLGVAIPVGTLNSQG